MSLIRLYCFSVSLFVLLAMAPPRARAEGAVAPSGAGAETAIAPPHARVEGDVAPSPAGAGEAAPSATLYLPELIRLVRERNPDLAALDASRLAVLERAVAAGSMPHPSVGFAVMSLPVPSFSFTEDMMTMSEVMVRQRFPWFGKRELRREIESRGASAIEAESAVFLLDLEEAAVGAYSNLWLAVASREVVLEQQRTLQRFSEMAKARYAAGAGSQSDILRADVERAKILEPLAALDDLELRARVGLAAILALESGELEGQPSAPPAPELPDTPAPLLASLESHPEIRALETQKERSLLEERLAKRDRWPDPEVGLMYGVRAEGHDMVGVDVMFTLPVFASSKEDRLAAAARADARSASLRKDARLNGLKAEARAAFKGAATQRRLLALNEEELLPRARRNLESAMSSYRSGSVDFLTLLDARVQLQTQELEALRTRAGFVREWARLQRAAGVSLFSSNQPNPEAGASEVE